jgi:hypothetical protein
MNDGEKLSLNGFWAYLIEKTSENNSENKIEAIYELASLINQKEIEELKFLTLLANYAEFYKFKKVILEI